MNVPKSRCIHIGIVGDYTKEDIIEKQESHCDTCQREGPHLWVCLHRDCLYVGCNESGNNHCVKHFQKSREHSLFLNLTSLRVYCLLCECEVFLENNDPPLPGMLPTHPLILKKQDSDSEDDCDGEENLKPKGLTGLQNLGNTCYMNSAIQALSNCPQLTNFFLECGSFVRSDKKPGLAKSYMRLMKEMWHRKRPSYVVPSGIAYGIKIVCPVFRGYTQQDAQEFLRCFMDQLHEELKEPIVEMSAVSTVSPDSHEELDSARADSGIPASEDSSQSDADYETCDSGLSSEKASCVDEGVDSQDCNIESIHAVDALSTATAHLSFKSNKYNTSCIQPSIHCSMISAHVSDINVQSKGDVLAAAKEKQSSANCDISLLAKDVCMSKDIPDGCETIRCEYYHEEKHATPQVGQSGTSSWNKESCVTNQRPQLKHMNPHALMNSIYNASKQKSVQFRSIISDIFDGKLLSSVQCLTCDTVSTTKETFQDLSLPIPNRDHLHMLHASQGSHQKSGGTCTDVYSHQGWFNNFFGWVLSWFWGPSVTLQDCLAAFFSADELKGDNMYSCEKCKKLRNGIKYSKVIELPEVLCIHLKRFRHEVMFSSKIGSYVSFPLEGLDMSPFLHKSYPRGVTSYDLASVICHHGTAGSGHYTAYCLNYLNDQWYEFDDQYVTAVDAEMVRHCEAYVLFYRKSGDEMIKKRQCAVELMERSRNEHGLLKFHISKQWINKFNNFAEPGPITNTDFLCIHGGVPPQKAAYADELCTVLPQAVWEYLYDTFSGGPPCTHLYICPICQSEQNNISEKRKTEREEFTAMNAAFQRLENPSVIYAISMNWFKVWENFVCKGGELPGPIDNSTICYLKNNQPVLKHASDYCSVSEEMYRYLHSIYGGGPDVTLQSNAKLNSNSCPQFSSLMSSETHGKSASSYVQNAEVHSSSKVNLSSHSHSSTCSSSNKVSCSCSTDQECCRRSVSTELKEVVSSEETVSTSLKHTNI
ncbi:ubiquitin carboxyl-terminal hydrolase 33-like [Argiope bruennichi]|uniref:ubiquitin carboxyl-terminal hydrolase 33-like n=1 Tax=Argiope bruennichi TaxID=94029 RepID=UPI00249518A4|nr:ubiquitin carboxyl-terminal hydrolase 33-like [Argiope bruennichi]